MPLILAKPNNDGKTKDVLIILGEDNLERMKEQDPFEIDAREFPWREPIGFISISYATQAQMTQIEQLVRQGKRDEALDLAVQTMHGFKYRPERGDHDLGPERLL